MAADIVTPCFLAFFLFAYMYHLLRGCSIFRASLTKAGGGGGGGDDVRIILLEGPDIPRYM